MEAIRENIFDPDEMPKWISSFWNKSSYKNIIAGINDDDCAVIKVGKEQIVITVDYLNSNPIALELGIGGFKDLGRLLVAANLSDLCGTGAKPIGFLSALMFDKERAHDSMFKELMQGIRLELNKHKIPLIGGDTKLGKHNSFCGIAIGRRERSTKLSLKSNAKVGDLIWLSSTVGNVSAAVKGLKERSMDERWNKWAKSQIIRPRLPLQKSLQLSKLKISNGGTDISDGLGADLWWLCEASKVGAIVDVNKIPIAKEVASLAKKLNIPKWGFAFAVGGDFQFLVTTKKKHVNAMRTMGFIEIGEIIKEREAYLISQGSRLKMPKRGHRDINANSFATEIDNLLDLTKKL